MNNIAELSDYLTIIVNSCDAYEDLWYPFFALLKKYWNPSDFRILLNTESKTFYMEGLNIECVHCPKEYSYGKRMLHVISQVKTKYVLPLLDDFFLRRDVDIAQMKRIIQWMETDPNICYFNCDCTETYADWEVDKYPGYRRLPPGNEYILNMQAAIWRTEMLFHCWKPKVTPWEWELITNVSMNQHNKWKFYCVTDLNNAFFYYGYNGEGMGVFRGKWVIEDVGPFFEKEHITVDYSIRGFYDPLDAKQITPEAKGRWDQYGVVYRCLGKSYVVALFCYELYCGLLRRLNIEAKSADFYDCLKKKAQNRFLKLEQTE